MGAWVDPVTLVTGVSVIHCGISTEESTVHWVYLDGTDMKYRRSYDEGTTFTAAVTIATGVEEIPADRPICSQNNVIIVFYCKQVNNAGLPPQIFYRRSTDYGATWSAELTIDDGAGVGNNRFVRLSSAIEGDRVYITWVSTESGGTSGPISLRLSTDAGSSFAAETNPFGSAVDPGRPDIAANGNWVHLTWTDSRDGTLSGGGETYYSRSEDYGATFGAEVNLSNTVTHDTLRPIISVTGSTVFIAWQWPIFTEDIYYRLSSNNGLTFAATTLIGSGTSGQEHAFTAAKGNYIVCAWNNWDTTPHSTSMRYSKDLGATWSAAEQVYVPATDALGPRIDLGYRFVLVVDTFAANDPILSRSPILVADPSQDNLLDDFNRANDPTPPPGANWTNGVITFVGGEGIAIVSNQACRASAGGFRQGGWYNATRLQNDQDIVAEISAWTAGSSGCTVYGRIYNPTSGRTCGYAIDLSDPVPFSWSLWRVDNVSTTALRTGDTTSPAAGDLWALTCRRELIMAWRKLSAGTWEQIAAVIDTTYVGPGYAALDFVLDQSAKITNLWGTSITEGVGIAYTKP